MRFSMAMQSTINTIHFLSKANGKSYCYPSQEKILKLLADFYGVMIKRRQLNYILAYLQAEGYIERKRRLKASPDGKIIFNTTLYWLKRKAFQHIARIYGAIKRTGFRLFVKASKKQKKEIPPDEYERYLLTEEQRRENLKCLRLMMNRL